MRFCSCCGVRAEWLSMRALCGRCQRVPGALRSRVYDWQTGKRRVKGDVTLA